MIAWTVTYRVFASSMGRGCDVTQDVVVVAEDTSAAVAAFHAQVCDPDRIVSIERLGKAVIA